MSELTLHGCRILVVEDEFMLADELCRGLGDAGAVVLGPAGTVDGAIELISATAHIDVAVLDVSLRGAKVFPVADLLEGLTVPFVFTTGYDASVIPPRFRHLTRCEKPIDMALIARALGRAVHGDRPAD